MLKRRNFLAYSFLFLASCTAARQPRNDTTLPIDVLRLSVSDVNEGMDVLEKEYGPFRDALAQVLDIPVELVPVDSHLAAAPELLANQIDLVFAGPSEYLVLNARAQAIPVIAATRPDYYTVFVVRGDRGIASLTDLKDKTIGMRTEGATASHIGATTMLQDAGLDFTTDYRITMVGETGLEQLMDGKIDAWADSSSRVERFVEEANLSDREVTLLAQGLPLPSDVFVARSGLDPDTLATLRDAMLSNQQALLAALTSAPANAKYAQSQFVAADDSDYREVREMYTALGLESLIQ